MVPEPGQRFGPYEILGQLGGGGMGIVFRAWDERLHREVAVKLLHDEYTTPGMRGRFLLEARAASALNHPNICTIFDIGEQDGEPYLVMEVLEGITLKQKVAEGAVPIQDLVRISAEVAEALAAAHAKGIIHRDIKPANIFLVKTPGGTPQAKVLDFGLAKISRGSRVGRASESIEITTAGSTVGTLAYMSPEQARGEPLDARSDLFSLGIVMYEMATRRVPFRGSTSALVYMELLSQRPEPIRRWNDTIPKDLERIILRLLEKDRAQRFQSANDLHKALRKLSVKGDGAWLKKVSKAAVPLVPSPDPVARENKVRKKESAVFEFLPESVEEGEEPPSEPDPGGFLLRPKRLPVREGGPKESAFVADKGSRGSSGKSDPSLPVISPADSPGAKREETVVAAKGTLENEASAPVPAKSEAPSAPGGAEASIVNPVIEVPRAHPPTMPHVPPESVSGIRARIEWERRSAEHKASAIPVVPEAPSRTRRGQTVAFALAALLLVVGAVAIAIWARRSGFGEVVLAPADSVLLTSIQNKTGDPALDGAVMEGLEIQLAQSRLLWRGQGAYRAGLRQVRFAEHGTERPISAREAARRVGARAYIYGELFGNGDPYTINLEVLETSSNDRLTSLSQTARGKDGLEHAIDKLASELRRKMGEAAPEIAAGNLSVEEQTGATVDALSAFAEAEDARQTGDIGSALDLYRKAASISPGFALAYVQLAWLEHEQYSEVAAGKMAQRATSSAARAGERVRNLAEVASQALDQRDYRAAEATAKRLLAAYPGDSDAMVQLARVHALRGNMTESLLAAEQAYRREGTDDRAYDLAGRALLGLDRNEEAIRLAETARQAGVSRPSWEIAAAYLAGKGTHVDDGSLAKLTVSELADRALALDDSGALAEGGEAWRRAARASEAIAPLASAAPAMLARGALNRAFLDHCTEAITMASESRSRPYGKTADFEAGLAEALCNANGRGSASLERLQSVAGLHSWIQAVYIPVLRAAIALSGKDQVRAQEALSDISQMRDTPPLATLLSAMAHLGEHHDALAASQLREVGSRPGYAFVTGTVAGRVAVIQLKKLESTRSRN